MCDCLVALRSATALGVTLFAKSSDRPPTEAQDLVWSPPRLDDGPLRVTHITIEPHGSATLGALLSRPRWCWGAEHGVNEAGVAIGNETIYTTLDPRRFPPALIGMDLVRLGLERAGRAQDAVDVITSLIEQHGQGGTGHVGVDRPYWSSFLVADPSDAWVIETSGRSWAAEQVGADQLDVRAISNRTTIPSFDAAHRHPRQPVEELVDPRWRRSQAVLARGRVEVAQLKAHLRSHGEPLGDAARPAGEPHGVGQGVVGAGAEGGWTVCMHVAGVEATTASIIAELVPDRPSIAHCLLGSPCRSLWVPIEVGEPIGQVPAWERFASLTDDDVAALRALEDQLLVDRPSASDAFDAVERLLVGLGR
jgi:hypothetical protein